MSDTIQLVKQSASHLKTYVSENFGIKLKTGHAQQLVAAVFDYKSYQSLITTNELILKSTSVKNYPKINNLKKSQNNIDKRILSIPVINMKLRSVSDELAEEVLIGILPACFNCGSCSELRWPFPIAEDVHWCCNKCTKLGQMESLVDICLTGLYSKAKEQYSKVHKNSPPLSIPVSRSVVIHKKNFMGNAIELALEGDPTKWDGIMLKVNQLAAGIKHT